MAELRERPSRARLITHGWGFSSTPGESQYGAVPARWCNGTKSGEDAFWVLWNTVLCSNARGRGFAEASRGRLDAARRAPTVESMVEE